MISISFLPKDSTPILQPIDVNIDRRFKANVKRYFHDHVIDNFKNITKPGMHENRTKVFQTIKTLFVEIDDYNLDDNKVLTSTDPMILEEILEEIDSDEGNDSDSDNNMISI